MAHEGCGAVTAATEADDAKGAEPGFIAGVLMHHTGFEKSRPSSQG
jgi:carbonic anhydrase